MEQSKKRPAPETRDAYRHFQDIQTRWMDNDLYGHVNNVNYYSYFDTVICRYLIAEGGLDIEVGANGVGGPVGAVCAESSCRYLASLAFPEIIEAGLRVGHLGRRSVRYEIGLFKQGEETAAAEGRFVHVFLDRETQMAVEIPQPLRAALERIAVD